MSVRTMTNEELEEELRKYPGKWIPYPGAARRMGYWTVTESPEYLIENTMAKLEKSKHPQWVQILIDNGLARIHEETGAAPYVWEGRNKTMIYQLWYEIFSNTDKKAFCDKFVDKKGNPVYDYVNKEGSRKYNADYFIKINDDVIKKIKDSLT